MAKKKTVKLNLKDVDEDLGKDIWEESVPDRRARPATDWGNKGYTGDPGPVDPRAAYNQLRRMQINDAGGIEGPGTGGSGDEGISPPRPKVSLKFGPMSMMRRTPGTIHVDDDLTDEEIAWLKESWARGRQPTVDPNGPYAKLRDPTGVNVRMGPMQEVSRVPQPTVNMQVREPSFVTPRPSLDELEGRRQQKPLAPFKLKRRR